MDVVNVDGNVTTISITPSFDDEFNDEFDDEFDEILILYDEFLERLMDDNIIAI